MAPFRSPRLGSLRFSLEVCQSTCMAVLVAAWSGVPAFAGQGGEATETGYSYYYFKEQNQLRLDMTRIAILYAQDERGGAMVEPDLSPYGLDVATVEPMAVRGWSFVKTTASIRTDSVIRRAASQVAAGEPVEFVSPVFVDDEGDPIVVTPDILVGFDRSLDPARAESILAESGAGEILLRLCSKAAPWIWARRVTTSTLAGDS
jgi:hypothetical protein